MTKKAKMINELDATSNVNDRNDYEIRQLLAAVVKTAVDDIHKYAIYSTGRSNYVDAVLFLRREHLDLVYDQTMKKVMKSLHVQITNRINKGWSRYRVKKFIQNKVDKLEMIMDADMEAELMDRLRGLR